MKNFAKNQKGVSLVELLIVVALMGILAGSAVALMNHVHYANTKKTIESIDTALDKQQSMAMSKSNDEYLYIYHLSDGYYMKLVPECIDALDTTKLDTNGTKIAGNGTEIRINSSTGSLVDGDTIIRIKYKKVGVFDTGTDSSGAIKTNASSIVVSGTGTYTITLVAETGKHPVS